MLWSVLEKHTDILVTVQHMIHYSNGTKPWAKTSSTLLRRFSKRLWNLASGSSLPFALKSIIEADHWKTFLMDMALCAGIAMLKNDKKKKGKNNNIWPGWKLFLWGRTYTWSPITEKQAMILHKMKRRLQMHVDLLGCVLRLTAHKNNVMNSH